MAASPPNPRLRARIELMIRIAAPALDLVLATADRVSRLVERDDPAYVPPRMPHAGASAPRGLAAYPVRSGDARRPR
jgi:hypothetical protein